MFLQPSEVVMAGEIVYADLRHPGDGVSPAEKHHAPALCPRWHGVLLKASGLGHLVLLVLVVVLSVQVFQGFLQPATPSAPRQGGEIQGRNRTERCVLASLIWYFCKPQRGSPTAGAGCKLCPQDWHLYRDRCYQLSKEKGNWTEGKKGCENQESHLVVLREEEEKVNMEEKAWKGPGSPIFSGVHQDHHRWRPAAGVDRINIIPQELDMGGQHIPQRQNIWHPAEDGRRVLDTER
ncbi:killer cell lectin-like receptor subfamily B member 1B allele C isoform X2 [Nyctibius grandis]|uniref:killer cell lectin-like receptor subfamily B member 1B allele C isoform X2 n=1 Tax=Nyctibius grandis TaxID=48427 RepID=UPI0035BBA47A